MSWRIAAAAMLGYTTGNLPDHGLIWTGVKLAFTVVMLVLVVRLARREAAA